MTARNDDIAGNPHRPKGFGRNGTVFVVTPSRNERALPRAARLEYDPVALRTLLSIPLLQATSKHADPLKQTSEDPPRSPGVNGLLSCEDVALETSATGC